MSHHGVIIGERDGLRVLDCADCGYAHLETMPAASDLDSFYRSSFWQTEKAGWLDRYLAQRDWLAAHHGDWLTLISKHISKGVLVDVGCGYGFFARDAHSQSWRVIGIEPGESAYRYSADNSFTGMTTINTSWQDARLDRDLPKANSLSALWLIEHLPDPKAFLMWARGRLVEGGVLLLAVPNDFSALQLDVNDDVKRPFWWIHPTHLNYFTWSSISNLLGLCGFRIVERTTQFDLATWVCYVGYDYTGDDRIGDRLHQELRQTDLEREWPERMKHYQDMARVGRGREIIVVAKAVQDD